MINIITISLMSIWSSVWPYLVAILVFLLMIAIHEFGHFISAKALGIKVNEYSIGFGPAIFKKQGKETLYALRAVPFGGYCAMEGEDEESGDSRAFCNAKPWKRFIVIVMGAIFNILLGFVLVMCMLIPEDSFATTTVHSFRDGAVSSNYGLQAGDKIVAVEGRSITTTMDLSYAFTNVDDGSLEITVKRDGKKIVLPEVKFNTQVDSSTGINYLEVDFVVVGVENSIGNFFEQAVKTTISYVKIVWRSLIDLITGKYGISAMSGPVGVTVAIGNAAKQNLGDLIYIISLITVNLGVMNLMPIPALDGSHALFILFEMIFRKPIPKKYETAVHTVGLILLLALIAIISIKDIIGLF